MLRSPSLIRRLTVQHQLRGYPSLTPQPPSWDRQYKVVTPLKSSLRPEVREGSSTGMRQEIDIRYVV